MKKIFTLVLASIFACTSFVACHRVEGASTQSEERISATTGASYESETQSPKFGYLSNGFNNQKTEASSADSKDSATSSADSAKSYGTIEELIEALKNGEIDQVILPSFTADYIAANNENLIAKDYEHAVPTGFRIISTIENQSMIDELSEAIAKVIEEGYPEKLRKTYITDVLEGKMPASVDMPKFNEAADYTVSITGNIPPFEYIKGGLPQGYNFAVLAEIAHKTIANYNVIVVEAEDRLETLTSKKADITFWSRPMDRIYDGDNTDENLLEGFAYTIPFETLSYKLLVRK